MRKNRFSICLPALVLLASACNATQKKIDDARALAQTGQADLAVSKLEELIAEDPKLRDAYIALGDVRFQAGAADQQQAKDFFDKAATAYEGALKLGTKEEGLLRVKQAVALALGGKREAGKQALDAAWSCCREPATLPMLEREQVTDALKGWQGTLGTWTTHPVYAAYPPDERTRFVVRPAGVELMLLESDEPTAALSGFSTGDLETEFKDGRAKPETVGEYVKYIDKQHPVYDSERGWVYRRWCGARAHGPCAGGPLRYPLDEAFVFVSAVPKGGWPLPARASLSGVDRNSLRCEAGSPTDDACPVTFKRQRLMMRRVALDALWLVPTTGVDAPSDALRWSHEAGLSEVRDRLAQGEIAAGLPEPLIRWAWGDVKPTFEVTPASVIMHFEGEHGTFTVVNGLLSAFEFKPFDREAAEMDDAIKESGDTPISASGRGE